MAYTNVIEALKGGSGSGNFDHKGIPGKHGGSLPGSGGGGSAAVDKGADIKAAKSRIADRAAKLGYKKVTFQPTKMVCRL